MAPLLPTMYKTMREDCTLSVSAFLRSKETYLPHDYGPLSAFGRQEKGKARNEPSFQFSRTDRLQASRPWLSDKHTEHQHADHEVEGRSQYRRPGFGDYEKDAPWDAFGGSGLQADFSRSLNRSKATRLDSAIAVPGAPDMNARNGVDRFGASYSSFGRQLLKRSEPNQSFKGVITRTQRARVYLGPEFEREQIGHLTPGPQGRGNMNPGVGKQVDSVKVTAPRATFGRDSRVISLDGVPRAKEPWNDPTAPCPHNYHETARFTRSFRKTHGGAATVRPVPTMFEKTGSVSGSGSLHGSLYGGASSRRVRSFLR